MPAAPDLEQSQETRAADVTPPQPAFWLPVLTLWQRELVRFLRQRSRLFGALGQPLLFWLLLGAGLSPSFQPAGAPQQVNYLEYFFPGTLLLILLFSAIFTNISIIEDRISGFLQSVLVAPVHPAVLVLGKVGGGATLALVQAVLFLLLAPLLGIALTWRMLLHATLVLALSACALTALGFAIAWRMDSTQGFHVIMNVFLIPLWLLSGAFFPAVGTPAPLQWIITINPVTYCLAALRQSLYAPETIRAMALPPAGLSLALTVAFALAMFGLALWSRHRAYRLP
ncbi:MAG: ABC transporter permease [candidate division KSB1 bacterium]|nr:ABC transporter permease [candidate division KSB1 bacterium]MDZ7274919.1 ABC transporter permease [candidate division KSB1 bacterium]MDZ7286629.1 ABC transporter permease [candidate division KSB1 bacterium]MDZ7299208.1 ABC transporter permease [candidate division KSB1 bacterium]MDZ7309157.1 ABC transporter permease [candidate division KSB1 bacterium]